MCRCVSEEMNLKSMFCRVDHQLPGICVAVFKFSLVHRCIWLKAFTHIFTLLHVSRFACESLLLVPIVIYAFMCRTSNNSQTIFLDFFLFLKYVRENPRNGKLQQPNSPIAFSTSTSTPNNSMIQEVGSPSIYSY